MQASQSCQRNLEGFFNPQKWRDCNWNGMPHATWMDGCPMPAGIWVTVTGMYCSMMCASRANHPSSTNVPKKIVLWHLDILNHSIPFLPLLPFVFLFWFASSDHPAFEQVAGKSGKSIGHSQFGRHYSGIRYVLYSLFALRTSHIIIIFFLNFIIITTCFLSRIQLELQICRQNSKIIQNAEKMNERPNKQTVAAK